MLNSNSVRMGFGFCSESLCFSVCGWVCVCVFSGVLLWNWMDQKGLLFEGIVKCLFSFYIQVLGRDVSHKIFE